MKKEKSIAGAVVVIILGILLIISGLLIPMLTGDKKEVRSDLYIIGGAEGKYGIAKADGSIIAEVVYNNIIMGKDVIYLKNDTKSYLYDLKENTKTVLDGMESDIIFPKSKEGEYIDKYILRFGTDESSSVYRIINIKGEKVFDKDYSNIYEAYLAAGAKIIDSTKDLDSSILGKDKSLVKKLEYLTLDGKYQYIVKYNTVQNGMYGIIDETGKEIAPFEYTTIENGESKNLAVIAKKADKTYVIPVSGKPIEIESGFEADINGEGYIIQKRGTTANKIYNLKGEVVIDKIFNYPIETVTLNSKTTTYLFIKDEKTTKWKMYDLNDVQKPVKEYTNINTEYLKEKKLGDVSTSFIYAAGGINYVVDLETFNTYKLGIATTIKAPLEPGYVLLTEQK